MAVPSTPSLTAPTPQAPSPAVHYRGEYPPKLSAGADLNTAFAGMPMPTLGALIAPWPIYIALAICQALTFHYVKKFSTPIFLGGVFVAALLFAMRYANVATVG